MRAAERPIGTRSAALRGCGVSDRRVARARSSSAVSSARMRPRGDDDRARADRVDLFEDVRRDHDDLVARHRVDQRAHFVLLVRIEAVGRLVEDQHRGIVQDRLREADAALEALRQRVDRLFEHALQMQPRDRRRRGARWRALALEPAHVGDEFEELAHASFRRSSARLRADSRAGAWPRAAASRRRGRTTAALPDVGARKPAIIFIVVDLPAPFGPRKPSTCRARP